MNFISRYKLDIGIVSLAICLFILISTHFQNSIPKREIVADQKVYYELSRNFIDPNSTLIFRKLGKNKHSEEYIKKLNFRYMINRGPGYPVYLALSQSVFQTSDLEKIVKYQIILNIFAIILLYCIVKNGLKNKFFAALCIVLYCFYFPFAYVQSYLITENLCHVLILAAIYFSQLLNSHLDRKTSPFLWLGAIALCLTWLYLTRGVYFYYAIIFMIYICAVISFHKKSANKKKFAFISFFLFTMVVPYGSWMYKVNKLMDQEKITFSVTGLRSIDSSLNESYDIKKSGFPQSRSGKNSKRVVSQDFKKSIKETPVKSFFLRVDKVYRLWHSPTTIYNDPILGSHIPIKAYHVVLIIASVFLLFFINGIFYKIAFSLPILYTTIIYGIYFTEEQRFIFPVMPEVLLIVIFGGYHVCKRVKDDKFLSFKKHFSLSAIFVLGGAAIMLPPSIIGLNPSLLQYNVYVTVIAFICLLIAILLIINKKHTLTKIYFPVAALTVLMCLATHQIMFSRWYIKKIDVNQTSTEYVKNIEFGTDIDMTNIHKAYISIDSYSTEKQFELEGLTVKLNGKPIKTTVPVAEHGGFMYVAVQSMSKISRLNKNRALVPEFKNWLIYSVQSNQLSPIKNTISIDFSNLEQQNFSVFSSLLSSDKMHCGPNTPIPHDITKKQMQSDIGRISLWKYQSDGDIRLYSCQQKSGISDENYPLNVLLHIFFNDGKEVIY